MKPFTLCLTLVSTLVVPVGFSAETHTFVPASGNASSPALRIKSGDHVVTTTVVGTGVDASGQTAGSGVGPLTGPFYIEGAEAGDLIVVTIEKLSPSSATGTSTWVVTPNAVNPEALAKNRNATLVTWAIDKSRGTVRLDLNKAIPGTDWAGRFTPPAFELPLRPMLSALGVAPAAKDARSSTPGGSGGGVLHYSGITAGARVMLPVFEPGALLSVGRGQATQGDGNITGTGVEVPMDVEFSVELVKKKEWPHSTIARPSTVAGEFPIGWPRVETDTYLAVVASADAFQAAFQSATLELHRWLDDDFGLSEKSVSILLGQALEYEIADIADPQMTVVAKIRKANLPKPVTPAQ